MGKFILNLNGPSLKVPAKLKKESFDYVGRYQIMAEIITQYFKNGKAKNVLDVGGLGTCLDQMINIPLTVLDEEVHDSSERNKKGDGARMQIEDGAYDVVVTSDTLEHIKREDRKDFVKELVRVSNDLVILAAPFSDNGAEEAEAKLQSYYLTLTGHTHRWLQEHADYVLPTVSEIKAYFKEAGMEPVVFSHSNIEQWRQMMTVNLVSNEMGQVDVHRKLQSINEFYNENILFTDFTDKGYRMFFVGSKKRDLEVKTAPSSLKPEQYVKLVELIHSFYENSLVEAEYIPKLRTRIKQLHDETINLAARVDGLQKHHRYMIMSRSWRYTAPIRKLAKATPISMRKRKVKK